jgi:hypothetical protein
MTVPFLMTMKVGFSDSTDHQVVEESCQTLKVVMESAVAGGGVTLREAAVLQARTR